MTINEITTKFEKYSAYKDSGIEWVGEIPEHWEVESFKNILTERNEKNDPVKSTERLSLSIDKGITLYAEKTTNLDRFKDDFTQYKLAYKGDLVFNSMNMIVGAVGVSNYFGCVSPVYYTYHAGPNNSYTSKFYEYLFKGKTVQAVLYSLGRGLLAIDRGEGKYNTLRLKVARHDLRSLRLPFPSLSEQKTIVNFLDTKCTKIDKAISQKEKMIALLKERKQILIQNAVTKGLDPDVEMKDSGVEWIGEVPEHWEMKKVRFIFSFSKGLNITKENLEDEGIPCVNYGEIHSKYGFEVDPYRHDLKCVNNEYLEGNRKSILKYGDFVFADTSEDIEGSGNFTYLNSNETVFAGYHTVIARLKEKHNPRFIAYVLDSYSFRNQIRRSVKGVKVYSITNSILKNALMWLPTHKEQADIVNSCDIISSKINKAIALQERQIERLKEYKSVLIDGAVTGKIKVY